MAEKVPGPFPPLPIPGDPVGGRAADRERGTLGDSLVHALGRGDVESGAVVEGFDPPTDPDETLSETRDFRGLALT